MENMQYVEVVAIVSQNGNRFLAGTQIAINSEVVSGSIIASSTFFKDRESAEKESIRMARERFKELGLKDKSEVHH